jgi:hypothetical protein
MAQKAILNTPVPPPPAVSEYQIATVLMQRLPVWQLAITYVDNLGVFHHHTHTGVFHATTNPNGADVLVKQLNTINLSTKSLEQRAKEHLDTCTTGVGETPGPATMSGSPD